MTIKIFNNDDKVEATCDFPNCNAVLEFRNPHTTAASASYYVQKILGWAYITLKIQGKPAETLGCSDCIRAHNEAVREKRFVLWWRDLITENRAKQRELT